jgi:hypothetical protein
MAKLSMAQRRALPKSDFLVPSKAPGPGSYPVPDQGHKEAAVGLAGMHHHPGIQAAARSRHPTKGLHDAARVRSGR